MGDWDFLGRLAAAPEDEEALEILVERFLPLIDFETLMAIGARTDQDVAVNIILGKIARRVREYKTCDHTPSEWVRKVADTEARRLAGTAEDRFVKHTNLLIEPSDDAVEAKIAAMRYRKALSI